ncbi:unnamed protein product [Closterium sp. NIES-53]
MDAEMASWKSTGTYVDEVPPPGANIVSGMWIFRVKRPPGSPHVFKARFVARGFSQRKGVDYFQTFSPTPKMTTLRALLQLLRRPPGFTRSFPTGTQWSLRRPVYDLRQAPREWHDTLRTTLAALGFAPSTADPSPTPLCRRSTSSCTAQCTITLTQSHMVQQVLQRFDFTYSSPKATPLSTRHLLSALPSDESVEPSGPYPELVGCLMYLMTCTRPDLAYPLSILARYVAPGRHRPEHMAAAKRVLRYLCSPLICLLTGIRSSCTSASRLPGRRVLYVDNKAMLALCREHRLEHRTKHIALRYFLARELQQRGQLRLAYVASEANTADIFTKALPPGDHQRFCTMLACLLCLTSLVTSCFPTCIQLILLVHSFLILSQCVHFGHPSAGRCQRSTGDPRLIIGKGYRLVVLGGYGRTDPLLNKPFYPNGLVVGILTVGLRGEQWREQWSRRVSRVGNVLLLGAGGGNSHVRGKQGRKLRKMNFP